MQIEGVLALTDGFPDVVPMTAGSSTPVPEWHVPIMVDEVVELLRPRPGAVIVDGTVGAGGHSISVVPRLIPDGRLIAVDRDPEALRRAKERLVEFESLVTFLHDDYRRLPEILQDLRISRIDGLILDLGVSSLQLGSSQRGFSFSKEGPLDMRMDLRAETTAEELVNRLPVEELARIFETFGEERFARRIARCIGQERHRHPITTTTQLAHLIVRAVPSGARHGRLHPATRAPTPAWRRQRPVASELRVSASGRPPRGPRDRAPSNDNERRAGTGPETPAWGARGRALKCRGRSSISARESPIPTTDP